MKTKIILALSLTLLAAPVLANEAQHQGHHKAKSEQKQTEKKAPTFNKYCPVSGGVVAKESVIVEYKGKKIGFCCPGCDKIFLADPEKYLKNLSADGQIWIAKAKQQEH